MILPLMVREKSQTQNFCVGFVVKENIFSLVIDVSSFSTKKAPKNIHCSSFLSTCPFPPPVFQRFPSSVFETMMWGVAFIRVSFFFSCFSFTDLPHFLPFLSVSCLVFQKHPSLSLHPLICSEAILSTCFNSLLLFSSSLPSFICLSSSSSCSLAK